MNDIIYYFELNNWFPGRDYPDDGYTPIVSIFANYPVSILVEILAHVAVDPDHDHDGLWKEAFENIYQEYNNLGINRYCKEE